MKELNIQKLIMLALSEEGCLIWRNNSGAYTDPRSGSFVRYGVGQPGGADLIGIAPGGRFLAVEVKADKGRPTKEQIRFIETVKAAGGIAGICRSPQEALELLSQ